MIGWDFSIFWEIGRAILSGQNPYAVAYSRYPPATAFFFVLFGLLPFLPSFAIWSGANVIIYLISLRRIGTSKSTLLWMLYTPFLFNLLTGQIDILFLWAAGFLSVSGYQKQEPASENSPGMRIWQQETGRWAPVFSGIFLTLKPQLAAVILPWFLLRWLVKDRKLLAAWTAGTLVLHTLPLLYDPGIYRQWLTALEGVSSMKMGVSSGVFAFQLLDIPFWVLALVALALSLWGLAQPESTNRAAQLSAFPITIWYDDVLLAGLGNPIWMVAISWLAFITSVLVRNSLPLITIPFGLLSWQIFKQNRAFKPPSS